MQQFDPHFVTLQSGPERYLIVSTSVYRPTVYSSSWLINGDSDACILYLFSMHSAQPVRSRSSNSQIMVLFVTGIMAFGP